jgi:hypothetical protein
MTAHTMDSAVCRAAADLLAAAAPAELVAHCYRTHELGRALLGDRRRDVDDEVLFVAATLHDLGLTAGHTSEDHQGFELVGARAASRLLLEHGASPQRAELAAAAVELHLELASADDPRPEVAAVHLGAALDVLGLRLAELPAGVLDAVLDRWPRRGFPQWLGAAMHEESVQRPESRAGRLVREVGLLELIDAAPLPR